MKGQALLLSGTVCHPALQPERTSLHPPAATLVAALTPAQPNAKCLPAICRQPHPARGCQGPGQQRRAPANISKRERWRQTCNTLCEQCPNPVSLFGEIAVRAGSIQQSLHSNLTSPSFMRTQLSPQTALPNSCCVEMPCCLVAVCYSPPCSTASAAGCWLHCCTAAAAACLLLVLRPPQRHTHVMCLSAPAGGTQSQQWRKGMSVLLCGLVQQWSDVTVTVTKYAWS
jgi:hypothetical protein